MDGVLYNSNTPISGAVETLAWVREQRIPHLFVTNTSSRSRMELVNKLANFGIEAREQQIMTPLFAAAKWLRTQEQGPIALFVLRATAQAEFQGFDLLDSDAETGANFVVIGDLGTEWNFVTLNRAFRLLHANPDARLIALGMTRYWQAKDGLRLDVAPFVAALECAVQRKALVFGKPSALFFQAAAHQLGLPIEDLVMVGDDIEIDVGGAQSAGARAVLVQTGKFRPADLGGSVKPDVVLESIAVLSKWWIGA